MGFCNSLFSWFGPDPEAIRLVKEYGPLMLDPINGCVPPTDSNGNKIFNIAQFNITGTAYSHLRSIPAKVIPRLRKGEKLVLAPHPENEYDPWAVRVLTYSKKQIGWVPRNHPGKKLIFQRLQEGYEIFCCVYDFGTTRHNPPWCEIKVVTYCNTF